MRGNFDFSSWQGVLSTLPGLVRRGMGLADPEALCDASPNA